MPQQRAADDAHRFWMVYLTKGGNPTQRHKSLAEATTEADRLCRLKTVPAFVLEVVGVVIPVWTTPEATKTDK